MDYQDTSRHSCIDIFVKNSKIGSIIQCQVFVEYDLHNLIGFFGKNRFLLEEFVLFMNTVLANILAKPKI